ncbi:MAG: ribonuclease E/G [Rhodospirillaceae bacterium]|nr:ribonuclease E/G [Rhodospirillaceae bacterium]
MPKIDTLLVDRSPGETRVAALAGNHVIEVYHHRIGLPAAGALYRGRVGKPLPGSQSVFVDIGLESSALLACGVTRPSEGVSVDVRIVQPPRNDKGAKVALIRDAEISKALTEFKAPICLAEAEHPLAFCGRTYQHSLKSIIVTPNDIDHAMARMLDSSLHSFIHPDSSDVFRDYGVDEAIERALDPVVPFEGGGKLIVEYTAALTAVDVDAGPMPVVEANKSAVDVLARELRLRAIAGPIIVDLIPSAGRGDLVERLRKLVADDPVPTRVSGLTPEGRVELNRRRSRASLSDLLMDNPSLPRPSTYAVALDALRKSVREGLVSGSVRITVHASERVVSLLRGPMQSARVEAEDRLKTSLTLQVVPDVDISYVDIVAG